MNSVFLTVSRLVLPGIVAISMSACATGAVSGRWHVDDPDIVPRDPDCSAQARVLNQSSEAAVTFPDMVSAGDGVVFDGEMFGKGRPLGEGVWFLEPSSGSVRLVGRDCRGPFSLIDGDVLMSCEEEGKGAALSRLAIKDGAVSRFAGGEVLDIEVVDERLVTVQGYKVALVGNCAPRMETEYSLSLCEAGMRDCRTLAALPEMPRSMAVGDNVVVMAFAGLIGGLWVVGLDEPVDGRALPDMAIRRDWAYRPLQVLASGDEYYWFDAATGRLIRHNKQFAKNAVILARSVCDPAAQGTGACGFVGMAVAGERIVYLTDEARLVSINKDGTNPVTLWSGQPCRSSCSRPVVLGDSVFLINGDDMISVKLDGSSFSGLDLKSRVDAVQ